MPRHRRSRSRRSRAPAGSSKTSIKLRKPTARTQQKQILSLARRVTSNRRDIGLSRDVQMHTIEHAMHVGTTNAYQSFSCNMPSLLTPCFGVIESGARYKQTLFQFNYTVDYTPYPNAFKIVLFFVRPKTTKVVKEVGLADSPTLTDLRLGVDYIDNEAGVIYFNPKLWHIDAVRKHDVLPIVTPSSVSGGAPWFGAQNAIRGKVRLPPVLNLNSRTGPWKTTVQSTELPPSQRQFMVMFSTNAVIVGSPVSLNLNCLSKGYSSGFIQAPV